MESWTQEKGLRVGKLNDPSLQFKKELWVYAVNQCTKQMLHMVNIELDYGQ